MRRPWLPILPAVALAVVGLHQVYAVHAYGLSPWKGGGFGMFSSTDAGPARRLRVSLLRGGSSVQVDVPARLDRVAERARALPTHENLEALGHEMTRALPRSAGVYRALRVEFWRIRFDDALDPTWSLASAVEVAPTGGER
ncbi:MAG: hypothetical protein JRG76_10520 [Deltaproteobacteria bacterium]|nr:hypothetical protein [Deltaproteobacteria bacterium]MBW2414931.1 hypothetical protein [Deltaproteobacteria bacterium]